MTAQKLIIKKQSGKELSKEEVQFLIKDYITGEIPDYQMAAFLMAVYFQGMSSKETYYFTEAMLDSGDKIDTSVIDGMKVDKHSTGGVGDKVSIILAPLVAAAGVRVPMISGRSLGHSGGTLDKLESIPGFKTNLTISECQKQLLKIGVVLVGQSKKLVPADKKLYALRDSTATIRSIPLITASILSKKLAEGIDALVIDVKVGKGAFFKNQSYALKLTDSLISISEQFNLKTSALFSAMDQPLGNAIGNWLEIKEAIDTLRGKGPEDLVAVTLALGAEMLIKAKISKNTSDAIEKLKQILNSGKAFNKFVEIVKHQGGKVKYIEKPELYYKSKYHYILKSDQSGYIKDINAFEIGLLAMDLGSGRKTMKDKIDYKAGIILLKKVGDYIERKEALAEIFTDIDISENVLEERFLNAVTISNREVQRPKPILGYATKEGVFKEPII